MRIIDDKVSTVLGRNSDKAERSCQILSLQQPFDSDSEKKILVADGEKVAVKLDDVVRGREDDPAFKV
jgi:hypothetical protein